jgi:hypothetical protein
VNARNRQIVEARAAGRPVQAIALEHGLSVARVSRIVQVHRKDLRIAELEAQVARLTRSCRESQKTAITLMRQRNELMCQAETAGLAALELH